jgi:hypothetical protein
MIQSEKASLRAEIIADVLAKYRLRWEVLAGKTTSHAIRNARHELTVRLYAAGIATSRVAQLLGRAKGTVRGWRNGKLNLKRPERRVYKILATLPADVREIVEAFAVAEDVSPQTIIRGWIAERARHEAESKARAA